MEFGRSLKKSWVAGNAIGRPAALRRSLASTMAIVGGALLVVTSTACDDECAPGEISVACPAEPESPPAPSPEPDVNISAPPSTCAELIPEFTREAFNRAENHDTCNDDDDCIVFSPQFLCGDDSSVTTCPVAIAQSAQATYQEELGAYSRALCEATPDLACIDVDECRTGRPFCNSGTCAFLAAPERTCAQIEADYNARVAAFERDGRNFSAADNCVLRSEPLVCDGDTVASPCPVAISPDFASIFDANLQQLREDRCAEIAERASPCTAPTLCADVYVDSRDGLQCVAIVDPASCPAPEVLAAEGPCSVEGKVCDVPCDESCGPENCGYTATCDAGQWSTTTPAPPPRCACPTDLDAAVGQACNADPNDPNAPPSTCDDECTRIRCVRDAPTSVVGTWAYASEPGVCDVCVTAVEGESCTNDGTTCSAGICGVCSFCNLLSCSPNGNGASTWVRLEVPPESCETCPADALPEENSACSVVGQTCGIDCGDRCDEDCLEATCTASGWSAAVAPADVDGTCGCPAFVENVVGRRCEIEGTQCENDCVAVTCDAYGVWRRHVVPLDCASCPERPEESVGAACTDDGLDCHGECVDVQCLGGVWTVTADTCVDGGPVDAGVADAGPSDAGFADSGVVDGGSTDAGSTDAGSTDAGSTDAGSNDAGSNDAGSNDAGSNDAGSNDAGSTDAGSTDAG